MRNDTSAKSAWIRLGGAPFENLLLDGGDEIDTFLPKKQPRPKSSEFRLGVPNQISATKRALRKILLFFKKSLLQLGLVNSTGGCRIRKPVTICAQ